MEEAAEPLAEGSTLAAIGADGENEWFKTVSGGILSFELIGKSRAVVLPGPETPPLYDSVVDDGEVYVPESSFIFLAGDPGDLIHISTR